MKCPHCAYIDGWENEKMEHVKGDEGEFFKVSNEIKMKISFYSDSTTRSLYGCPKCNKVFMGY